MQKKLILFIHGFRSGKKTWQRKDKYKSIYQNFKNDKDLSAKYDFEIFDYFTKVSDIFSNSLILGKLFGWAKTKRNISIIELSELLETEIKYKYSNYESIIIVAHSMGGLVTKSLLIRHLRESKMNNIHLFISLAVPHGGSNIATIFKRIFKNPQLFELATLSRFTREMEQDWAKYQKDLPKTIYFQGKGDKIVYGSEIAIEDNPETVYTSDDHFSIVRPPKNDICYITIRKICKDFAENSNLFFLDEILKIPNKPINFIGRESNLTKLEEFINSIEKNPIPVLGMPGIGKSTLISLFLHDDKIIEKFKTHRYFIRCDNVKDLRELYVQIGEVLTNNELKTNKELILKELNKFPSILVLDNAEVLFENFFEEIIEFANTISHLKNINLIFTIRGTERPSGIEWHEKIELQPLSLEDSRKVFLLVAGRKFTNDINLEYLIQETGGIPQIITLLGKYCESETQNLKNAKLAWDKEKLKIISLGDSRYNNVAISYELSWNSKKMDNDSRIILSIIATLPEGISNEDGEVIFKEKWRSSRKKLLALALVFDDNERIRLFPPLKEYFSTKYSVDRIYFDKVIKHFMTLSNLAVNMGKEKGGILQQKLKNDRNNIEFCLEMGLNNEYVDSINCVLNWGRFIVFSGYGSIKIIELAKEKAIKSENIEIIAKSFQILGNIHFSRTNYKDAYLNYEEAIKFYQKTNNIQSLASCIRRIGGIHQLRVETENAVTKYNEALNLYLQLEDISGEAMCKRYLGEIEILSNKFTNAHILISEAQKKYKIINDINGIANCIRDFGDIHLKTNHLDEARLNYEQAISKFEEVGDIWGIAECLQGLADVFFLHKDYSSSLEFYNKSLKLYYEVGIYVGIGNCYKGIAQIEFINDNRSSSIENYLTSIQYYESIPNPLAVGQAYSELAKIVLTEKEKNEYNEKAKIAFKGIERLDLLPN